MAGLSINVSWEYKQIWTFPSHGSQSMDQEMTKTVGDFIGWGQSF